MAFVEASHTKIFSQICHVLGAVYNVIQKELIFHIISWALHRSYCSAKSKPAAKILAASDAVNKLEMLKRVFNIIFKLDTQTMEIVDSKNLHKGLFIKQITMDKSVRLDVNEVRFYFKTEIDIFV